MAPDKTNQTRQLPIIPLRTTIVFPGCVETLQISQPHNLSLLQDLKDSQQEIALLPLRENREGPVSQDDFASVGVLARAIVVQPSKDNTYSVTFEAGQRMSLERLIATEPYCVGEFVTVAKRDDNGSLAKTIEKILAYAMRILETDPHYSPEVQEIFKANRDDAGRFIDTVAHHLHFSFEDKRELLIGLTV
jgi:ATP-dependent Lon protease